MREKTSFEEFLAMLKHFSFLLVLALVALVISFVAVKSQNRKYEEYLSEGSIGESQNTERVYGDQRVFDYGDQLTDSEEIKLTDLIHEAEKKVGLDIVIVTLNESLADFEPEYMSKYTMRITPDKYVMVYADKFWEDNKFGYDGPQVLDGTTRTGDGVLLVDNVFREPETNKIYTWMCTTGKAERAYSSAMIDAALDVFYEDVEYDYYRACCKFVERIVSDMTPETAQIGHINYSIGVFPLLIGAVILFFYVVSNRVSKVGGVTVNAKTYLVDQNANFTTHTDEFLRKSVSKVYNPPSSSSGGGGGHHSSGGGGSHGGGGHSR